MSYFMVIDVETMDINDCSNLIKQVREYSRPYTQEQQTEIQCLAMNLGATVEFKKIKWKKT